MEVTLTVRKANVYNEVSKTTSYTGAKKMDEDDKAYKRIMTKNEDEVQLNRFWDETCTSFCEMMKKFLKSDNAISLSPRASIGTEFVEDMTGHQFVLELSQSFDEALLPSMRQELTSYFVMNITAKWYVLANKAEAQDYAVASAALLEGIHRKACYKKKPTRPTYRH